VLATAPGLGTPGLPELGGTIPLETLLLAVLTQFAELVAEVCHVVLLAVISTAETFQLSPNTAVVAAPAPCDGAGGVIGGVGTPLRAIGCRFSLFGVGREGGGGPFLGNGGGDGLP
jgi:hypothetical protein